MAYNLGNSDNPVAVKNELALDISVTLFQNFTLAADAVKRFNVANILGSEAEKFDLETLKFSVLIEDTGESPTAGLYVAPADALLAGQTLTGEVSVVSTSEDDLKCLIQITVCKKT